MEAPYTPHALPSQAVFDLWTLWTFIWLAKTSNKPISLTTWLAVNPLSFKLQELLWKKLSHALDVSYSMTLTVTLKINPELKSVRLLLLACSYPS